MFSLEDEKDYFASWFQKFLSTISWSHGLQACAMTASDDREHILEESCLPHDGQEARKRSKDRDRKPSLISYYPLQQNMPTRPPLKKPTQPPSLKGTPTSTSEAMPQRLASQRHTHQASSGSLLSLLKVPHPPAPAPQVSERIPPCPTS